MPKYSAQTDPDRTAKAYGYEMHCSFKDSMNLADALRGMKTEQARNFLDQIIEMKRPLPTIHHNKKRSHQPGTGPGSYPQKAARYMLKILDNAMNNAEYKGFDADTMKIIHISTYRGRVIRGVMPRAHGRATDKNTKTTNIEIILEEAE